MDTSTRARIKVTIPRREWYRGKGAIPSRLLQLDGTGCCLGHVGQACGVPIWKMLLMSAPSDVVKKHPDVLHTPFARLLIGATEGYMVVRAMQVNDRLPENIGSDLLREEVIIASLAALGFDIEFVGEG